MNFKAKVINESLRFLKLESSGMRYFVGYYLSSVGYRRWLFVTSCEGNKHQSETEGRIFFT